MATRNPRFFLKMSGITLGLVLLLIYGLFQTHEFMLGPKLEIISPKNGESFASTSTHVLLQGRTENISFLTINGLQAFTDENGDFSRKLLLPLGYTIITVEAQDKFKRSIKRELQLFIQ